MNTPPKFLTKFFLRLFFSSVAEYLDCNDDDAVVKFEEGARNLCLKCPIFRFR